MRTPGLTKEREDRGRDLFPLPTDFESARAVRLAAIAPRDLIDEAPDIDRSWFDTDEDYELWLENGCQSFWETV